MAGMWLVIRRALHQRLLTVAALGTALLATTILVALGGYVSSVTDEGLRRTLGDATFGSAGTSITTTVDGNGLSDTDAAVRKAVANALDGAPATVSAAALGDSYALPGQEHEDHPQLTAFAMHTKLDEHARLTAGRWPRPGNEKVIEAALPAPAAHAMRMPVGSTATLHSRLDDHPVTVRVTGVFQVNRTDDYAWANDPLIATGIRRLDYTTFGPLVVDPEVFGREFAAGISVRWSVLPHGAGVHADALRDIAHGVRALPDILKATAPGRRYIVSSSLPDLLTRLDRALLVARSTMLIPVLQLVVLAGYALLLVARLLAEHRRMEVALMRARGAASRQVGALAIGEGLLITTPAAIAAPFLAPPLLHAAAATPTLKATGLRLALAPSALTWTIAVAAAIACALALTLPTLRGIAATYVANAAARGRGERRGALQRAGADLALVVLAALAVWQLARYGGPVTTSMRGSGIDPVIVAGPALAVLAGGVVILRLIPLASRVVERIAARGRGFAAAIGARQVGRRPLRYAGPALLLVMAMAVGVLSVTTGVTWRHSQIEQADFTAGTDLRVTAPHGRSSPASLGQGGRYAALPDVTTVGPVLRTTATAGDQDVTLLATDAAKIPNLAPGFLDDAATKRLTAGRPSTPSAMVLGQPTKLAFDLRLDARPPPSPSNKNYVPSLSYDAFQVSAVVVDAMGVAYGIDLGSVPADAETHRSTVDLTSLAGQDGVISYPLAIRGIGYRYNQIDASDPMTLTVESIRGGNADGLGPPVHRPSNAVWAGHIDAVQGRGRGGEPEFRSGGFMRVRLPVAKNDPGTQILGLKFFGRLDPPGTPAPELDSSGHVTPAPVRGIVTADLAARAHVGVGGRITLTRAGTPQPVVVTGIVPKIPSTDIDRPAVLLDWTTLTERAIASNSALPAATEWWLAVPGADTGRAAAVLDSHPNWTDATVDRTALRHRLRDAPLGGGLNGALIIGFIAAVAFAVIGFAVNAAVSVRERLTEFAVMRALGVGSRQVLGLIAVEQAFLVGLGLVGGTLLGLAVAHLVVPHVVLTVRATSPYPPVDLLVPWPAVLAVLGGTVLVLGVVLLSTVWALRHGLGGSVRLGEDR